MQKSLFVKAVLVAAVFSILLVPLSMIRGIVTERASRQQAVVKDVAASSFGRQLIVGPVLSIPYTEEYVEEVAEGRERRVQRQRIDRTLRFFPADSETRGTIAVGEKHRGLFKVRTFNWRGTLRGNFVLDGRPTIERTHGDSTIVWGPPSIGVALSDPRGLSGTPVLEWAGERIPLERGSGMPAIGSGLHATAPAIDPTQPQSLAWSLAINLQGTESLGIVPAADSNRVSLQSDWPHPSFAGQFLPQPESQQIGKEGFAAEWTITGLASKAQQQIQALNESRKEGLSSIDRLEIGFIEPIDIYSLSDRALKYAFLFIGLTFGCFLLFEVLKRLPVHPAQYALVGLALATFFLLLIALSEHIAFWIAYAIAASACIALLGFYLSAVFGAVKRGVSFATMLTALYGALYGLLVSEDNALLLGSLLVFGLIATAMVSTRKVDWYQLGVSEFAASKR